MSSAVLFLLGALLLATTGSAVLWLFSGRHRHQPPDYREQLRAIAPRARPGPIEQPSGIRPLEELAVVDERDDRA